MHEHPINMLSNCGE